MDSNGLRRSTRNRNSRGAGHRHSHGDWYSSLKFFLLLITSKIFNSFQYSCTCFKGKSL